MRTETRTRTGKKYTARVCILYSYLASFAIQFSSVQIRSSSAIQFQVYLDNQLALFNGTNIYNNFPPPKKKKKKKRQKGKTPHSAQQSPFFLNAIDTQPYIYLLQKKKKKTLEEIPT